VTMLGVTLALSAQTSHAQKIGIASATRNQVEAVITGTTRKLGSGGNVFSKELIRTGEASLAQLLFLDETTLTVGAKSQVVLDKFVYNPNRAPSNVILNAGRGAFRFVSGSQSPTNYQIETPSATIGVRGTIVDLLVWADRTIIILVEGSVRVTAKATRQSFDLREPGRALIVNLDGRVEGPRTWDATIYNIVGTVPFPLFGTNIWPSQRGIEIPDSRRYLNDELNASRGGGVVGAAGPGNCPPGTQFSFGPGGVGGACLTPAQIFSDIRLKRDVSLLKYLDNGLGLYSYRYLWSDTAYVGVMAQEVQKIAPESVVRDPSGYLKVDYGALGLQLRTFDDWKASKGQ
jgi:FecR protein/Chaperone of endosialidase